MHRLALAFSSMLVSSALLGGVAAAQPAPPDGAERAALARDQFQQGVRFARRGQWQDAADRFARALELRETPQIRYNLAESLFHLGRLVEASEHVAILERDSDVPRDVARSHAALRERIDEKVGRLTIGVAGAGPSIRVTLDGRDVPAAIFDRPMPVDPGRHVVRLLQGDREVQSEEVLVPEGASAEVSLEAPAPPTPREVAEAAAPAPPEAPAREPDGGGVSPWVWVAIAAAVIAGGVVTGLVLLGGEGDPTQGDFDPGVLEVR